MYGNKCFLTLIIFIDVTYNFEYSLSNGVFKSISTRVGLMQYVIMAYLRAALWISNIMNIDFFTAFYLLLLNVLNLIGKKNVIWVTFNWQKVPQRELFWDIDLILSEKYDFF